MNRFPESPAELKGWFTTEDECRQYLFKLRWPEGFRCPRCQHDKAWKTKRGLYSCSKCNFQVSVTAGTIFHGSRKPLRLWFKAIWYLTNREHTANAIELQRILGFGSYRTAWEWSHKLRLIMGSFEKSRLNGEVEVDKFYIGDQKGRTSEKALVIVAAKHRGVHFIRETFRLAGVRDESIQSITGFIMKNIEVGSIIRTDTWPVYNDIKNKGYHHKVVPIDKATGKSSLSLAHCVISSFKKWLQETYSGAVRPSNLDYYLDEYFFRFNPLRNVHSLRNVWDHRDLFHIFMKQALVVDLSYENETISG